MNHNVAVIEQIPLSGPALDVVGLNPLLRKLIFDLFGKGAHLRVGGSRSNDKVISEHGKSLNVYDLDVAGFLLSRAFTAILISSSDFKKSPHNQSEFEEAVLEASSSPTYCPIPVLSFVR